MPRDDEQIVEQRRQKNLQDELKALGRQGRVSQSELAKAQALVDRKAGGQRIINPGGGVGRAFAILSAQQRNIEKLNLAAGRRARTPTKLFTPIPKRKQQFTPIPRDFTQIPRSFTPIPRDFTPRPRSFTPIPRTQTSKGKTISSGVVKRKIPPITRKKKIGQQRLARERIRDKKFISFDPELGKRRREEVTKFIKREIGFNRFENESNKEEEKLIKNIDNFAEDRQNFYQSKVNTGKLSVGEANKKLNKDIEREWEESINKNEFFREKNPRKPTTNNLAYEYETQRLEALKKGEQKRADAFLFLKIPADLSTSLVKTGIGLTKEVNTLMNDPVARETSLNNLKKIFGAENLKTLPKKADIKIQEINNYVQTSPTTAIAQVVGNLVAFGIITKAGKPVLKVTGVLSKNTSKQITKNLKFQPFVKEGLKGLGTISVEISPKVLKQVGKATKTSKSLAVSNKATQKLIRNLNKAVSQSKIGVRKRKLSKKLSKEGIRLRKRRLRIKLRNLQVSRKIRGRVAQFEKEREKAKLKKIVKKRRKSLQRKVKRKEVVKKIKESKVGKVTRKIKKTPKRIAKGVSKTKPVKKIKEVSRKLKEKKEIKKLKRIVKKRRKEKILRRKKITKQEKFRKSKLGKLKIKVSKEIKRLDDTIKKFESPSAKLVFDKTKKTPLSRTFPKELKFEINDKAVENLIRLQARLKGVDFDKLSGIDKNFLIGGVKLRIRNNPEKYIPKTRQIALRNFRKRKEIKKGQNKIKIKVQGGGEITLTKIKPVQVKKPISKPSRTRGQTLLQVQKQELKKPTPLVKLKIQPVQLNVAQKKLLNRFKKNQAKQKTLQKEINTLKQKTREPRQFQLQRQLKQRTKIKTKQLARLVGMSAVISRQLSKQVSKQLSGQMPKQSLKVSTKVIQNQIIRQAPAIKSKINIKIAEKVKLRQVQVPLRTGKTSKAGIIFKTKKKKVKKKPIKKKKGYNVFARPIKKRKSKKKPKLVKVNKRPLTKSRAEDVRNFISDRAIIRTARIKQTRGKPQSSRLDVPVGYAKKTKAKFRSYRIVKGKRKPLRKGKVIERNKFIQDTRSEKKGLTLRRAIKRLEKRSGIKRKITKKQRNTMVKNLKKARRIKAQKRKRR